MEITTARLRLRLIAEPEARRICDRAPTGEDAWAADYPFEGDLAALASFLHATGRTGEPDPFGYSQITRRADGLAIGGIGFKGPPTDRVVEVGYGLGPSARGHGYAAEALQALVRIAAGLGVTTIRADTDRDNVASQRTLENAGFSRTGVDSALYYYERRVAPDTGDGPAAGV
jgi:RimJ/RimL family protein N-acetyltransferase